MDKLKNFKDLKDKLGNSNIGASVLYLTDVKMRTGRKDKVTGEYPNPLASHDVKKKVKGNVKFNHRYESAVQNRANKVGGDDTFESEGLSWGEWIQGYENALITHNDKNYVRLYFGLGLEHTNVTYLVDGRKATEEELAIIKEYKSEKKPSAKQLAHGIEEKDQVMPKAINLDNILEFKCGDYSFSED